MAILYNLTPLKAIDLFYDGEKRGVWNGDFIKNQKKTHVKVPPMLREFLEKYGYLEINKGQIIFFHPDDMRFLELNLPDGGKIHILAVGIINDIYLGCVLDDENGELAVGEIVDNKVMWGPSDMTLSGALTIAFVSLLYKSADNFVFQGSQIEAVLKKNGMERSKIMPSEGHVQHTSLNFNEETGAFITAEFDSDGENITTLCVTPRKTFEQRKAERYATISLDELNSLFEGEFFGNSVHCDYAHASELQQEIIKRMESCGADELVLTDHYRLAARCLWELERIDEAQELYDKTESILVKNGDQAKLAEYYHTMMCFYGDIGQEDKSDEMFTKELDIRQKCFPDDVYNMGLIFQSKANYLNNHGGDPDKIIELCELALEQYKKDPYESGCKYMTARVYQLRAEAKKRKKGLNKS